MTKYIKVLFTNKEPLKIADSSKSKSGQSDTLSHILGTSIRGTVIEEMFKNGVCEEDKKVLLSEQVSFLNAYPVADGNEMIPSLKGFYEDKKDVGETGVKEIENVLKNGEVQDGNKRASLGKYCYIKDNCICYTQLELGSDMKINTGKNGDKRNVFRNKYISSGYQFTGYIAVRNEMIADKIKMALESMKENENFFLGGSRSYGYGKCIIDEISISENIPYTEYSSVKDIKNTAYMVLLSHMAMIDEFGQLVGIDETILAQQLGVQTLEIERCSTSIVEIMGYNRTWASHIPSVKMYEMGSVFRLDLKGNKITAQKINQIMNQGIGIRTNEGFGRVLFFSQEEYEGLLKKKSIEITKERRNQNSIKLDADEERTLKIIAKGYYHHLLSQAKNEYLLDTQNNLNKYKLNNSQLGSLAAIIYNNLYESDKCFQTIERYFENLEKKQENKRVQKSSISYKAFIKYIRGLKEKEITDILPVPQKVMRVSVKDIYSEKEIQRIKLELILSQIKRVNRGGVNHE